MIHGVTDAFRIYIKHASNYIIASSCFYLSYRSPAFSIMPRLFHSRMLARLGSFTVMAAGSASLLLAGDSKAALYNACKTEGSNNPFEILFKNLVTGDQFQCQDKLFTIGDPRALIDTNDYTQNTDGGSLKFEWSKKLPENFPFENDIFSLSIDFVPNQNGPASGSFEYWIAADAAAGYSLKDVGLDSTAYHEPGGSNTTVTKAISDPFSLAPIVTLTSTNGLPSNPEREFIGAAEVRVVDSWIVGSGDTLEDIKNSYRQDFTRAPGEEVPGPLPLLGAGAAFGFSRRLRSRLLAARRV